MQTLIRSLLGVVGRAAAGMLEGLYHMDHLARRVGEAEAQVSVTLGLVHELQSAAHDHDRDLTEARRINESLSAQVEEHRGHGLTLARQVRELGAVVDKMHTVFNLGGDVARYMKTPEELIAECFAFLEEKNPAADSLVGTLQAQVLELREVARRDNTMKRDFDEQLIQEKSKASRRGAALLADLIRARLIEEVGVDIPENLVFYQLTMKALEDLDGHGGKAEQNHCASCGCEMAEVGDDYKPGMVCFRCELSKQVTT